MELKEFLQKFLPDYEKKRKELAADYSSNGSRLTKRALEYLDEKMVKLYFQEALQSLESKICTTIERNLIELYQQIDEEEGISELPIDDILSNIALSTKIDEL
jgi:uncharacterized protein YjaG (DUF416 family)